MRWRRPSIPLNGQQTTLRANSPRTSITKPSNPRIKAISWFLKTSVKPLLDLVKWVDENSSVSLKAPTTAKPGQTIQVTVETKGGMGPVVGSSLVDLPLRLQARPIASDGWYVVGKPKVVGADGKEQTWWLDKRVNEKKNLSFILVQAKADVEKKALPTTKVTWNLRAPVDPGTYTVTAAFLYGTEEPDEMKSGKMEEPPGGARDPRDGSCSLTR